MAGLYLVGAWLMLGVADVGRARMGRARSVVALSAIGFVPAIVFSWLHELTPDGLRRDAEIDPDNSIAPHTDEGDPQPAGLDP